MYTNKRSVRRGDDDYNLTYYEDSIEKVIERVDDVDKQLKDVNRRVSANLTVLKCAVFTIICLVLVIVALISLVLVTVNTSNMSQTGDSGSLPSNTGGCTLSMDGDTYQYLKLEDTNETHEITVIGSSQWQCNLTFLAVGGGGHEDAGGGDGGAGSGYLKYVSIQVNDGTSITADVGNEQQPSNVKIWQSGNIFINYKAESGQDGQGPSNGGRGYCGGAAEGQYNGGTNGGDGEGAGGGKGTGEDITQYIFRSWTLSPGRGGKPYTSAGDWYGGGGGGVLVDGGGPMYSNYQGSGYGGGGGGYNGNGGYESGLPGVILIEVIKAE